MRQKRHMWSAALIATLTVSLLSACGSNGNNSNNGEAAGTAPSSSAAAAEATGTSAPKKDITLMMSTFNGWTTDDSLKAGIAKAEEITGYKVDLQVYPDDQYQSLIKTKLAVKDVPDIIDFYTSAYTGILPLDSMEPLQGDWIKQLPENSLKYVVSGKDGNVYTAPRSATNSLGIIYNKEAFEKAGIQGPFKNYDELMNAMEALKQASYIPLALANKESWNAQVLFQMGGIYLVDKIPEQWEAIKTNKKKIGEVPEIVDLFKRILSLKDKGYLNDDYMSTTIDIAKKYVVDGKAAMLVSGTWEYGGLLKDYPDQVSNLGFTQFSFGDAADPFVVQRYPAGSGFWVPKSAKNKEAAKEFINVMMSEPVMQIMFEKNPGMPEFTGMNLPGSPWGDTVMDMLQQYPTYNGWSDVPSQMEIGFDWGNSGGMGQDLLSGKSIDKVLADWYDDYSKANKAKEVPGF